MKYLIIGGNSVLAAPLSKALIEKNPDTKITVTSASLDNLHVEDGIALKQLNIQNAGEVSALIKETEADVIFDLESQSSVGYAWKNPKETVDINVIGTINILNAIKESEKHIRLVIGGSGEEYGNQGFDKLPISEDEAPHPVNIFGATKAAQTMFAKLYTRAYGLDIVVLRTFNETSVQQDEKWAISSICKQFVRIEKGEQEPVIHVGNVDIVRDFTDVDDLARAFIAVAEKGKTGEIYNAARGNGVSLSEVLNILSELTGVTPKIRTDKSKVRPIDVPSITADVSKIKEHTGWEADTDIKNTLQHIVEKWRNA